MEDFMNNIWPLINRIYQKTCINCNNSVVKAVLFSFLCEANKQLKNQNDSMEEL